MNLDALKKEARQKSIPLERLRELAHMDPQLSRTIAKGKHTPVALLEELAESKDDETRLEVGKNPNTPAHTLERLAEDASKWVVLSVARHPALTPLALERIAAGGFLTGVAGHPSTPIPVLETLMDEHLSALLAYQSGPDAQGKWQFSGLAACNLACNSALPPALLERLLTQIEGHTWAGYIREQVAAKASTDPAILERLSNDARWQVVWAVARNPRTPTATLQRMAFEGSPDVQRLSRATLERVLGAGHSGGRP